jgi:hypothetical protein
MTGPIRNVERNTATDGTDTLSISFSAQPDTFTISITRFAEQPLDVRLLDDGCWALLEDGSSESSEWITIRSQPATCSGMRVQVALSDAQASDATGHRYFRTPGLLLRAAVDDRFAWASDGSPTAADRFTSTGTVDDVDDDGRTWRVDEAGGLASGNDSQGTFCQTDDPATGRSGPWHCESVGWSEDDAPVGQRKEVTTYLPGAYYNLAESDWADKRDLAFLAAGALVGVVGSVVFRLIEDATLGRSARRRPRTG